MDDDHDSWLSSTFGVSLDDLKAKASDAAQSVETKVDSAVQTVAETAAPVVQAVEQKVDSAVEAVTETAAPVVQAAEQKVDSAVQTVTETVAPTVQAVEQNVGSAVETVKDTAAPAVQAVEQAVGGAAAPSPEFLAAIRSQMTTQISTQTANPEGLIDQLNNLDSFRKTDPDPVPDFPPAIDPKTLLNDIKEKEFNVAQLETQRTGICKQARADARQATDGAKSDLLGALVGGAGVGAATAAVMAVAAMSGGSLALLAVLCTGIIAEHEVYRKLRDTMKSIVTKAHSDLIVINTTIAIERKKLVVLEEAAQSPPPDDDAPNAPE